MRVLEINTVCGYGSTGRIVTDLADTLVKYGHECMIAYGRGTAPQGYNTYKIDTDWEIRAHGIKTRLTDKEGFGSRRATIRFIKVIKDYNPNVIHLHNLHGYYINLEILFNYLAESKIAVVWTLHDCWAFTGHCSHFDYIRCNKWKIACNKCPQKKCYPKSFFKDNSYWNYEKKKSLFTSLETMIIITPSSWLAELVKQSFLNKYLVRTIYNGIDLERFKPIKNSFKKKYNCERKQMILGIANIWNEYKGLKTFEKLLEVLPNEKYQVVMVGLKKHQAQKMPSNLISIERTESIEELAMIYSAADVFANPTLEDNFPTTNLEALSCGTPVVTNNTGGSPEAAGNECGRIVYSKTVAEFVEKIQECINEEYSSVQCSLRAKKYDRKVCFAKYIQLYNELIDNIEQQKISKEKLL